MTGLLRRWRNAGLREHTPRTPEGEPTETALVDAAWPAIVTRGQVEAVHEKMAREARGPILVARKHLLSGIATCAKCGQTMQADATTQNGIRFETYRCRGGATEVRCSTSIRRDVVDEKVLNRAASLLALPSAALVNVEATRQATALRAERAEIIRNLKALESADFSREFTVIMLRGSGFQGRVRVIDSELERLSEFDALAALVADLRPLTPANVATFTLPEGNRATVRARLDDLRVKDLGKLRRVLRSPSRSRCSPGKAVASRLPRRHGHVSLCVRPTGSARLAAPEFSTPVLKVC